MWNWSDQTGIKAEAYDLNKSGANVWISNTFQTMCTAGSSGQQQSGLVNRSLKQWPYIWTFFVKSIIIINCRQKTLHWYWYWGWGSLGGSRWRSGKAIWHIPSILWSVSFRLFCTFPSPHLLRPGDRGTDQGLAVTVNEGSRRCHNHGVGPY